MKKNRSIRRFVNICIVFGIIFLVGFFSLNYTINNNDDYLVGLVDDVSNNYDVNGDIVSVNLYGGYYVVVTDSEVLVLDNEYGLVFNEDISKLSENINDYDLVYRTNKLMYEDTVIDDDKLIYNFYDAYSYDFVSSIVFE